MKVKTTLPSSRTVTWAQAVVMPPDSFSPYHFILGSVPFLRANYRRMTVFYIELRNLTLVGLHLFCQKICCKLLLQERRAFILLIGKNALNRGGLPLSFTTRRGNTVPCEAGSYRLCGLALNELAVDTSHGFCFLRHTPHDAIRTLAITEELPVTIDTFANER